jgi:hypothetical protein
MPGKQATGHLSSMKAASEHPAYQEIISLGPGVVPCPLRDLKENERHRFIALRTVTGANPIPKSARRPPHLAPIPAAALPPPRRSGGLETVPDP